MFQEKLTPSAFSIHSTLASYRNLGKVSEWSIIKSDQYLVLIWPVFIKYVWNEVGTKLKVVFKKSFYCLKVFMVAQDQKMAKIMCKFFIDGPNEWSTSVLSKRNNYKD